MDAKNQTPPGVYSRFDEDQALIRDYDLSGRNASGMAAKYGIKPSAMRTKVAAAKARLKEFPMMVERLDPEVENLIEHEMRLASMPLEGTTIKQVWVKGKHLSLNLVPDAEQVGPRWPVIQQVEPRVVSYTVPTVIVPKKMRVEVVLPDTQFGYQRLMDSRAMEGNLESYRLQPIHDPAAIDIALQVISAVQPTGVTHVGDIMDFSEFSRYLQVESFFRTTQAALDTAYDFLCDIRSIVGPEAPIRLVDGNHDEKRIATYVQMNARAAYGLVPARTPVTTRHDMTLSHLLRLDTLDVTTHGTWPGAFVYLVEGENALVVTHDPQKPDAWQASVISGHTHHRREHSRTQMTGAGKSVSYTHYEIGCLCSLERHSDPRAITRTKVPSDRGFVNGWQNGLAVVEILVETGEHRLDFIPIRDKKAMFRGQLFAAKGVE